MQNCKNACATMQSAKIQKWQCKNARMQKCQCKNEQMQKFQCYNAKMQKCLRNNAKCENATMQNSCATMQSSKMRKCKNACATMQSEKMQKIQCKNAKNPVQKCTNAKLFCATMQCAKMQICKNACATMQNAKLKKFLCNNAKCKNAKIPVQGGAEVWTDRWAHWVSHFIERPGWFLLTNLNGKSHLLLFLLKMWLFPLAIYFTPFYLENETFCSGPSCAKLQKVTPRRELFGNLNASSTKVSTSELIFIIL